MTTQQAFALAALENLPADQWRQVEERLTRAGWCPGCAEEGERAKLGKFEPATHETYGGRWCPACEMFWPEPGERGRMEPNEPDYGGAVDAGGNVVSDALPGF